MSNFIRGFISAVFKDVSEYNSEQELNELSQITACEEYGVYFQNRTNFSARFGDCGAEKIKTPSECRVTIKDFKK